MDRHSCAIVATWISEKRKKKPCSSQHRSPQSCIPDLTVALGPETNNASFCQWCWNFHHLMAVFLLSWLVGQFAFWMAQWTHLTHVVQMMVDVLKIDSWLDVNVKILCYDLISFQVHLGDSHVMKLVRLFGWIEIVLDWSGLWIVQCMFNAWLTFSLPLYLSFSPNQPIA